MGDAVLNGLLAFLIILVVVWSLWYFLIFENFMEVTLAVYGWDFYPVEDQLWWMVVGWIILAGFSGALKVYDYSRRGNSVSN
ncbi:hypothetical protein LCGC14_1926340 [marine sediment metagenome]|uniref:Uncharacterized protein n=1 Tax=marine sediment metagenome TaxID=412755 RepID=A0A0F9FP88_9ZZZZ